VKDTTGQPIAYVYFEDEPQRHMAAIARRGTGGLRPTCQATCCNEQQGKGHGDMRNEILPRLGGRFILHKSPNQKVRPNQREGVMVPVISANALLVWFVWGFFMAIGWALGTWVVARLLGMVWRERP
jgi:hypothetical protein